MPDQTIYGKAFEYACLKGIEKIIKKFGRGVTCSLVQNKTFDYAELCFNEPKIQEQQNFLLAAGEKAASRLKDLEPRLIFPVKGLKDNISLEIQPDEKGIAGDVRDVIAIRILLKSEKAGWEIGISCKHNHFAVKHQRISPRIDIGLEWMKYEAGDQYFKEINIVFDKLKKITKSGIKNWSNIKDKDTEIYKPLMIAIKNQIERNYEEKGKDVCEKFLTYLIGKNDFYKVISENENNSVIIQGFNFNDTLNKSADKNKPKYKVKKSKLPSKLFNIEFVEGSNNTILINMNEGWSVSMRIHNAATKIEQSLKLDVQLTGVPPSLYRENLSTITDAE